MADHLRAPAPLWRRCPERLLAIEPPTVDRAVLHATQPEAKGIAPMVHFEALDLAFGDPVTLAPGGRHPMLMGPAEAVEKDIFPMIRGSRCRLERIGPRARGACTRTDLVTAPTGQDP